MVIVADTITLTFNFVIIIITGLFVGFVFFTSERLELFNSGANWRHRVAFLFAATFLHLATAVREYQLVL